NMGVPNGAAAPATPAGRRTTTGENAIPVMVSDGSSAEVARSSKSGASRPQVSSGPPARKPTPQPPVAAGRASGPVSVKARPSEAGAMFVKLAESIDDTLDAEMHDVARSVGALRRDLAPGDQKTVPGAKRPPREELERTPMAPMTALAAAAALPRA